MRDRFPTLWSHLEGVMVVPKIDKRKEHARYAAHCMYLVTAASDPDGRTIQEEMAAEWINLAGTILQPLNPVK
jgi:hypothetical protein